MGRKIFVSYKYADSDVHNFTDDYFYNCTVRDYVDKIEDILGESDNIYKGESDGEDLSQLSEETIWNKLKNRIYDSSLTIVMISPQMKEGWKIDSEQWIPREISYSLKEISRVNKNGDPITSKTNAMLAVVLPDNNKSYTYYINDNNCCSSSCRTLKTNTLFSILRKNMFNMNEASKKDCDNGTTIWYGDSSYIHSVKWEDFVDDMEKYINKAYDIQDNIENYTISKEV